MQIRTVNVLALFGALIFLEVRAQASLVPKVGGRGLPTFEQVIKARHDPAQKVVFEEFKSWAENLTPQERGRWMRRDPSAGKGDFWSFEGCSGPQSRGVARAMIAVARNSKDLKSARTIWTRVLAAESVAEASVEKASRTTLSDRTRKTVLGRQLERRAAIDKAWRTAPALSRSDEAVREALFYKTWPGVCKSDLENVMFLKRIVRKQGWPLISVHGVEASKDAWLIVQHADQFPEFQSAVLGTMTSLVSRQEVDGKSYALLFDRVALSQGRPQRFGTQFGKGKGDCVAARPVENPSDIDALRSSVGLESLKDYARKIESNTGMKVCSDPFDTAEPLSPMYR